MSTTKTKHINPSQRKKKLSPKQKLVQASAQQRQKVQDRVFAWQEQLFTQERVSVEDLQKAAFWLQPQTYDEIVEERCVQSICGYPLCSRPPQQQQSRYRISLSQRKVFDQSELASYCSLPCLQKSKYYNMQLSEDPVWIRDMASSIPSNIHIITLEENFEQAVAQQQQRNQLGRSSSDLRQEYVQQLLSNVPLGTNNNTLNPLTATNTNEMKMVIVEKTSVTSPLNTQFGGIHDAIEGFRIDNKSSKNEPSTILLKPKHQTSTTNHSLPTINDTTKGVDSDELDPESLLDDAMETMMMLKKMNLDHLSSNTLSAHTIKDTVSSSPTKDMTSSTQTSRPMSPTSTKATKAAVAAIEAAAASAAQTKKMKNKKKKKEPEMSLFGKIWTMLDRMTTKSTRLFLTTLAEGSNSSSSVQLLEEDGLDHDNMLRGHIFSEKILETYGLIRTQLGILGELEMDLVNLIRTFRFTDATMVVLDSTQTYMMTLVLFKTLATDILKNETDWQDAFEVCCHQIGQSSDGVDACVRVLKVAST
ncbi:Rtr1/RPAP2 family-domain-containing protein [Halteromyces radiatus]|uniref:Rtr1/RPAP2 family-domain-containing protein n=1 Tax=Halteromyces radiatus TaxID=101107 RepID=UPI00221F353D|nr:Rtr1/RPAP2 family-domain-containing protein [Halteromyces radiatus]KAI8096607.1 Rtr1/RPAP2 family-domain-containing protein [Halteromyces radiatus]